MKAAIRKWFEICIESINYIIISYALGCLTMVLKASWLSILFTASEFWLLSKYLTTLNKLTKNKIVSGVVWIGSFVAVCLLMYFIGHIDGTFLPFASCH